MNNSISQDFRKFHRSNFGYGNMSAVDNMISGKKGFKNIQTPYIFEEKPLNNVTQLDIFSRLMMDRILFIGSEINSEVANIVVSQLLFLENSDPDSDITVYLNTPGGSVYDGNSIVDVMNYVKPKISTICTGLAASYGAIILISGEKGMRKALRRSRIMLHQPLGGVHGQASDIEITANEILKIKDELYQVIVENSNMSMDEVIKRADRDHWLTSKEALDLQLIDEIITKSTK